MGHDTYGDDGDQGQPEDYYYHQPPEDHYRSQPEAYWRRRVIALGAGLALMAVLAWAFSGSGKAPSSARPASQAASQSASQSGSASALPAAAYSGSPTASGSPTSPASGASGSASVGSAAGLPFPTVTSGSGQPSKKTAARATASGKAAQANQGTPGNGTGVLPGGGCAPGAVVLSLFTSRTDYYAGQYPSFQIDAVSTATRTCTFDISPRRLHVQVMSSGRVIWDSADCSRGTPDHAIELRRGVPTETSATWRRVISLPGCVTVASSARPGSYQVQAKADSVASPVRSFKLVR